MPHRTVFETRDTRCWHDDAGALMLTFEQPRPTISPDVVDALERAVGIAEHDFKTLVIGSAGDHFAFGANLDDAFAATAAGHPEVLNQALERYQRVMLRLRYATVPTIAAVSGVAISGGCEVLMHCTRVVAAAQSHIGLVEPSVGVLPGGGGLKEFALRASQSEDCDAAVVAAFDTIAASTVARTAADAVRLGFLRSQDRIDVHDVRGAAAELGRELHADGHRPPETNPMMNVAGPETKLHIRATQAALHRAGKISTHQLTVNSRLARVLCGGDAPGTTRSEADMLALERLHFVLLARSALTQARLAHLKQTGRALDN